MSEEVIKLFLIIIHLKTKEGDDCLGIMEEVFDKLKVLNYEKDFLSKKLFFYFIFFFFNKIKYFFLQRGF